MEVSVFNRQNDLPIDEARIKCIVQEVVRLEGQRFDEAAVHFVSREEISSLHERYFNDPAPTDCISFPADLDSPEIPWRALGDVFVCPRAAIEYAAEKSGLPEEEAVLYLVHGLLHLMGYDDLEEEKRRRMRKAEERHISNLKKLHLCGTQ